MARFSRLFRVISAGIFMPACRVLRARNEMEYLFSATWTGFVKEDRVRGGKNYNRIRYGRFGGTKAS